MTSWNGTFSALLAICAGNSPVSGELPSQRPVTRSFDVYFDLRLDERLSKHSLGWWLETPHYDVRVMYNTLMFHVAAVFVKYCYTTSSSLFLTLDLKYSNRAYHR